MGIFYTKNGKKNGKKYLNKAADGQAWATRGGGYIYLKPAQIFLNFKLRS
jgi:hypothetical protein